MDYQQPDVTRTLGPLLAGTWVSSGLYSIELTQAWEYFSSTMGNGQWAMKTVVVLMLLIDTVSVIGDYSCVWLYCVKFWGSVEYASAQPASIPIYLITTGLVGMICQLFLIVRVWRLSKNWWLPLLLVGPVGLALTGAIGAAQKVVQYPRLVDRHHLNAFVTIWLVSSAACDVLIALTLLWYLNRVRKSAARFEQSRLTSALGRLCLTTVETGATTAVFAIIVFSVYISDPELNISTGLCYALSRLYSLTVLITLNQARHLSRQPVGTSGEGAGPASKGSRWTKGGAGAFAGVEILHTATVRIDDERDGAEGREVDLEDFKGPRGVAPNFPNTFTVDTEAPGSSLEQEKRDHYRSADSF